MPKTLENYSNYHTYPKFLDRQDLANSAEPDQTAPRGTVRGAV